MVAKVVSRSSGKAVRYISFAAALISFTLLISGHFNFLHLSVGFFFGCAFSFVVFMGVFAMALQRKVIDDKRESVYGKKHE